MRISRNRVGGLIWTVPAMLVAVGLACGSSGEAEPPPAQERSTQESPTREPATPESKPRQYDAPPPLTIDPAKSYTATIELEKGGEIVIDLLESEAPQTVNNFVFLARDGYYDGVTFHRVLEDFMAQSGDPTGLGNGGPGYTISDEFSPNARHDSPGTLSMANTGRPNSGGSQWFITFGPTPWLDDRHTVFGKVTEGMDVVNGIALRDPQTAAAPGDAIRTIRIDER